MGLGSVCLMCNSTGTFSPFCLITSESIRLLKKVCWCEMCFMFFNKFYLKPFFALINM